jgi:hypothetical protein
VKPALYVLGGIFAALGVTGLSVLLAWTATELLGPWGLFIEYLSMLALGGGYVGWSVYRMRAARAQLSGQAPTD